MMAEKQKKIMLLKMVRIIIEKDTNQTAPKSGLDLNGGPVLANPCGPHVGASAAAAC